MKKYRVTAHGLIRGISVENQLHVYADSLKEAFELAYESDRFLDLDEINDIKVASISKARS